VAKLGAADPESFRSRNSCSPCLEKCRALPRRLLDKSEKWAQCNLRIRKAADGGVRVEEVPVKEMPAELKQVIEENK
jgi:hypothetical protein